MKGAKFATLTAVTAFLTLNKMTENASATDKIRAVLVLAATAGTIAFNSITAAGYVNGVTPAEISDKYQTVITPAGYAFSIWSLIYLGLIAFSIYQIFPGNLARLRPLRSPYILSCALNCAWIFFWHSDQIAISFAIIASMLGTLVFIVAKASKLDLLKDSILVKAPFGLYLGWLSAATLVNFAILLVYLRVDGASSSAVLGAILILVAAGFAIFIRSSLKNYLVPIAVAWALTAIAVKQSGNTLIVTAAAAGVIACLIAALSFVVKLPSSADRVRNASSE